MSGMSSMEYRKDCIGEKHYASRNHGSLRHTYQAPGASRATVDWSLQLRQPRSKLKLQGKLEATSASMPNLHTGDLRDGQQREPLAAEHPSGAYHDETETMGRYQNLGNTGHMLQGSRRTSGAAHSIDWQLNLRDGLHRAEFATKWRRHYARPQQSFDMMKENCGPDNAEYQRSHITPQDRRIDRRSGALPIETIQDDPISFHRWAGCEGTHVGQWKHLIEDHSRGRKTRRAIQAETTLRGNSQDPNGARITDNRSDGCIIEMLGKKRWTGAQSHEPLATRFPHGDAKLYHLSNLRLLPETDEENRQLRMSKQPRRCDTHEPQQKKKAVGEI